MIIGKAKMPKFCRSVGIPTDGVPPSEMGHIYGGRGIVLTENIPAVVRN
jgi:hypothetical protein